VNYTSGMFEIECESCKTWQHGYCEGVAGDSDMAGYNCYRCTNPREAALFVAWAWLQGQGMCHIALASRHLYSIIMVCGMPIWNKQLKLHHEQMRQRAGSSVKPQAPLSEVRPNPGEGRQLMVYIAKEDETVTQIAKRLGMNAPEIISLNKNRYQGLTANVRLMGGTSLQCYASATSRNMLQMQAARQSKPVPKEETPRPTTKLQPHKGQAQYTVVQQQPLQAPPNSAPPPQPPHCAPMQQAMGKGGSIAAMHPNNPMRRQAMQRQQQAMLQQQQIILQQRMATAAAAAAGATGAAGPAGIPGGTRGPMPGMPQPGATPGAAHAAHAAQAAYAQLQLQHASMLPSPQSMLHVSAAAAAAAAGGGAAGGMRPPAGVPNKATAMPMTSQMAGAQMQPMASPTPMMQQLSFALSHHAVSMRHRVRPQSVLEARSAPDLALWSTAHLPSTMRNVVQCPAGCNMAWTRTHIMYVPGNRTDMPYRTTMPGTR